MFVMTPPKLRIFPLLNAPFQKGHRKGVLVLYIPPSLICQQQQLLGHLILGSPLHHTGTVRPMLAVD